MKIIKSLLLGLFLVARFECSASVRSYESCLSAKELYNHALFKQGLVLRRFHNHDVNGVQQCSEDHFCNCKYASRERRLQLADQIVSDACKCLEKSEPVFLTSFGAFSCNLELLIAQLLKNYGFVDVKINAIDRCYTEEDGLRLAILDMALKFGFPIQLFDKEERLLLQPEGNHIFLRVDMTKSCQTHLSVTDLSGVLYRLDNGCSCCGSRASVVPLEIESLDIPEKRILYAYSRNPLCFVVKKNKEQDAFPDDGFMAAGDDANAQLCAFLQQETYSTVVGLRVMICPTFYKLLPRSKLAYEIDEDKIGLFRTAFQDYLVYDGTQGAFLSPERD